MSLHAVIHWLSDGPGAARVGLSISDEAGTRAPMVWGRHTFDPRAAAREARALEGAVPGAVQRGAEGPLVAHGGVLFDLWWPAWIKAALRAEAGHLTVVTDAPHAPWPLLHDGARFLGLAWALGTVPVSADVSPAPAPVPAGERLLLVADPAQDLPAARHEGEALLRRLAQAGRGVACDLRLGRMARGDFLRLFRGFRLLHFAGHADPADAGGPGGWRFADGRLTPDAIAQLAGGGAPALVFANACQSIAPGMGDLAPALLGAGVRHLIGTAVDVPDLPAATFAGRFYDALRDGLGVGAALLSARQRAAGEGDGVWAAYRLFGAPGGVYFRQRRAVEVAGGLRSAVVLAVRAATPEGVEPERFAEALEAQRAALRQRIEAQGGRLLPGRAAVARAVFGAPVSYENDAERAARAALAVAQAWPDAVLALEAGRVLPVGVDVLGPAVQAAEGATWRLPPGVYVLPTAAAALRDQLVLAPAAEGAQGVLGWSTGDALPRLVGRGADLDRLREALATARAGGGAAVTLVGPAGIGKTRLTEALVAEAEGAGARVLRGAAVAYDEQAPFAAAAGVLRGIIGVDPAAGAAAVEAALGAWLAAVDAGDRAFDEDAILSIDALVAGDLPGSLSAQRPALEVALGLRPGAGRGPGEVPSAVARAVTVAARRQPLLIVLEDVHWLPPAGQAVAGAVIEAVAGTPALVLATARPTVLDAPPPWWSAPGHTPHTVGPLDPSAAAALLGEVLPAGTPAERAALAARAEGNPLFLRELGLARASGSGALPVTVEAVVRARVDRLPAPLRAVLRAAAVVGRVFYQGAVEALLDSPGLGAGLAALARLRFVARAPSLDLPGAGPTAAAGLTAWRFQHALVHEVVYHGTEGRARVAWHGRAALWLGEAAAEGLPDRWARIATHRDAAGDHARAAEAWLAAADAVGADVAPAEARAALEAALRADDAAGGELPAGRRAQAEARLASLLRAAGEPDAAAERLHAALARTPEGAPVDRAQRLQELADLAEAAGDPQGARAHLAAGLAAVAAVTGEGAQRVRALLRRDESWLAYRDGDYDQAVALGRAAMAEVPAGAHLEAAGVANVLGVIHYGRGDDDTAATYYRQARAGFERVGRGLRIAAADNNLGILAMRQGDFEGAAGWLKQAVRRLALAGDREALARTYNNLGTLYGEQGDLPRAARYLQESIAFRARTGHAGLALGLANLAEVWLKQGRWADARARLGEAIALCEAGKGPGYLLPDAWRMLAELHLAEGDPPAAVQAARTAWALADGSGDAPRAGVAGRVLGEALAATGDAAGARAALDGAIRTLRTLDQPLALSVALLAWADHVAPAAPSDAAAARAEAEALRAALAPP